MVLVRGGTVHMCWCVLPQQYAGCDVWAVRVFGLMGLTRLGFKFRHGELKQVVWMCVRGI